MRINLQPHGFDIAPCQVVYGGHGHSFETAERNLVSPVRVAATTALSQAVPCAFSFSTCGTPRFILPVSGEGQGALA